MNHSIKVGLFFLSIIGSSISINAMEEEYGLRKIWVKTVDDYVIGVYDYYLEDMLLIQEQLQRGKGFSRYNPIKVPVLNTDFSELLKYWNEPLVTLQLMPYKQLMNLLLIAEVMIDRSLVTKIKFVLRMRY